MKKEEKKALDMFYHWFLENYELDKNAPLIQVSCLRSAFKDSKEHLALESISKGNSARSVVDRSMYNHSYFKKYFNFLNNTLSFHKIKGTIIEICNIFKENSDGYRFERYYREDLRVKERIHSGYYHRNTSSEERKKYMEDVRDDMMKNVRFLD